MNHKKLIVLGCPRSGTSLVANILSNSGYDLNCHGKKQLMKKNPKFNPNGYFERIDIVKMNDQLIRLHGKSHNFLNPPNNSLILDESITKKLTDKSINPLQDLYLEEHKDNYIGMTNKYDLITQKELIEDEMNSYENWLIKDSRMCYTLPLWNLKNITVIKVSRNPEGVKKSMETHYGEIFEKNTIFFKNKIEKVNFEDYYKKTNELIDLYMNNYGGIEITLNQLINHEFDKLENFLDIKIEKNIVNSDYIKYKT
jgi:hypothetical protein